MARHAIRKTMGQTRAAHPVMEEERQEREEADSLAALWRAGGMRVTVRPVRYGPRRSQSAFRVTAFLAT